MTRTCFCGSMLPASAISRVGHWKLPCFSFARGTLLQSLSTRLVSTPEQARRSRFIMLGLVADVGPSRMLQTSTACQPLVQPCLSVCQRLVEAQGFRRD